MIKWLLTTIILALVVAVVTVTYQSPALRAKSEKWLKAKIALVESRFKEIKSILESKEGARGFFADKPKDTIKPTTQAEKTAPSAQKKPGAVKTTQTAKTGVKPAPSSTAKSAGNDEISDADKKRLEQVLEKANQAGVEKK